MELSLMLSKLRAETKKPRICEALYTFFRLTESTGNLSRLTEPTGNLNRLLITVSFSSYIVNGAD